MRFLEFLLEGSWPIDTDLKQAIKAFRKFGYEIARETPHIILKKENSPPLSLPNQRRIKSTILRQLCMRAEIPQNKFLSVF